MTNLVRHPRAAFTLPEAICALIVAAFIMITATTVLHNTINSFTRSTRTVRKARKTAALGKILRQDIKSSVLIGEDEPSFRVIPSEEGPQLSLVTTNSFAGGGKNSGGLHRVRYVPRRRNPEAPLRLVRVQKPYLIGERRGTGDPLEETLVRNVAHWSVECYDGSRWRDIWEQNTMPPLVRIRFAFGKQLSERRQETEVEGASSTLHLAPLVSRHKSLLPSRKVWPSVPEEDEDTTEGEG